MREYLNIMFDPHEYVCLNNFRGGEQVAIRLDELKDETINSWTKHTTGCGVCLNPHNGINKYLRKAECFDFGRTYLIEWDHLSIREQKDKIRAMKIEPTAILFTGNRSIHCLLITDRSEPINQWRANQRALATLFGSDINITTTTSTRIIGSINPKSHRKVEKIGVGDKRIDINEIYNLLGEKPKPRKRYKRLDKNDPLFMDFELSDWLKKYIIKETDEKFILRCPFHEDHSPSAVIWKDTDTFWCPVCNRSECASWI